MLFIDHGRLGQQIKKRLPSYLFTGDTLPICLLEIAVGQRRFDFGPLPSATSNRKPLGSDSFRTSAVGTGP